MMDLNEQKHETARLLAIELVKKLGAIPNTPELEDILDTVVNISVDMANKIHDRLHNETKSKNLDRNDAYYTR